ncbi:hypothetical protein [Agromyces aerolatus]|uniref:hypothetical protein n=1 Tax=Agromyces sp. LY-1074 TaxID=3074080 RepID=UPI0028628AF8|nr:MULTISPECIES: hypothetical protein [unclassified Agromyces]MDR5699163.1 hypothetical protein [Agromyces sp. LY-1074]MDR5705458.1 hypothetical protein [Agromyces sp. LY-1358]
MRQSVLIGGGSPSRGMRARWGVLLVAASASLALAGCAPVAQTMTDAAAQGRSAVETASLALELEQDGRSIFGVSSTAFDDAQRELSDAATTVDEADVSTEADRALRAETADALRLGLDAVNAARESMRGVTDPDAALRELDEASARLGALVDAGAGG